MVRSPKSARQAQPSRPIRILALPKEQVRWQDIDKHSKSYPLQVSVYHRLTVHIYQPLGDAFELRENECEGLCHQ